MRVKTIVTVLEEGRWINRIDGEKLPGDFQRRVHAEKVAESLAAKDGLYHEVYDGSGELIKEHDYSSQNRGGGLDGIFRDIGMVIGSIFG